MPQHVLPNLSQNHTVPNIPNIGEWNMFKSLILDNISEGLSTSDIDSDYFNVDAIPDVWARPLLFELALYDNGHPLHNKIVGEWRGLVSMIALKEFKSFPLSMKRIELKKDDKGFSRVIHQLAPMKTLSTDTIWTKFYIILFNEKPIGITSPTTLFCTSVEYRVQNQNVTWFNQVLRDPLFFPDPTDNKKQKTLEKLNAQEKNIIANWLEKIKDKFLNHNNIIQEGNLLDSFFGIIDKFLEDLGGKVNTIQFSESHVLGMNSNDIYQYVDNVPKPREREPNEKEQSHVRLVPSKSLKLTPKIDLLICEKGMWGKDNKDINVTEIETLETAIPYSGLSGPKNMLNGKPLNNAEWRTSEDFFTKKLTVINNPSAFTVNVLSVDGTRNLNVSPVLPIQEELLAYLTAQEIANRTEIRKDGEKFIVKIKLPLSGPDNMGNDFLIQNEYTNEDLDVLQDIPVLEVWPNFVSDDWKEYYCYFNNCSYQSTLLFEPFPKPTETRAKQDSHNEIQRMISKLAQLPEAMLCKSLDNKNYLGMILLKQAPSPNRTNAEWHVGVDFGTTNTSVYIKQEGGEENPFVFSNLLFQVCKCSETNRTYLFNEFIPFLSPKIPFLTAYHEFNDQKTGNNKKPILDGHIYYRTFQTQAYESYLAQIGKQSIDILNEESGINTNLKWSSDTKKRELIILFLQQLCYQIRAEAKARGIASIKWLYSTPSSFSADQESAFDTLWTKISLQDGELTPEKMDKIRKENRKTESLATAIYFLKKRNLPVGVGTICIDIGGGSSDIAIWKNNKLCLQTSFRLAGREIFIKTLGNSKPLMQKFFNDSIPYIWLEHTLSQVGDSFIDKITTLAGTTEFKNLNAAISVGLGGILYYCGLSIKYLVNNMNVQPGFGTICFAGNGAKMLDYLDSGHYGASSHINHLFKKILKASSDCDFDLCEFSLSSKEHKKHEVAYGLIAHSDLQNEEEAPKVIAGEKFQVDGVSYDWDIDLTTDLFNRGIHIEKDGIHLARLLSLINDYSREPKALIESINFSAADSKKTLDKSTQELIDFRGKDKKNINVEPLFIILLRNCLEVLREK